MRRAALGLCLATLVASVLTGMSHAAPVAAPSPSAPPIARRDVVVDSAFGLRLEDPYQWMERSDSEFLTWLRAQGDFTRGRLDAAPQRRRLVQRLRELSFETSEVHSVDRRGTTLFYLRDDKGNTLARLVVRGSDGKERVLVDPNRITLEGEHVSIDNYSVSWDGKLVAVNLAPGGSEVSRVVVFDTATGLQKPDTIEHIWGEFPVNWLPDGSGFYYTQMADAAFRDPKADRVTYLGDSGSTAKAK